MNRIIFDKIIQEDDNTFAFVAVPDSEEKDVPFKGKYPRFPSKCWLDTACTCSVNLYVCITTFP